MGIEIVKITDFDVNLDLLIQQYKDKPNFYAILQALNTQAEDLETALFEIRDNYWVASAVGDQLDVLGDIQKEARLGKSDTDYRTAIQARIVVNNGSGEFETIIVALTELFGATMVHLQNQGNANLYLWTDLSLTETDYNRLLLIIPAGVKLWASSGSSNPFVFYGDDDGQGFGKLNEDGLTFSDGVGATFSDGEIIGMLDITSAETDADDGGEFQGLWS